MMSAISSLSILEESIGSLLGVDSLERVLPELAGLSPVTISLLA
jgi:hypothetical protein